MIFPGLSLIPDMNSLLKSGNSANEVNPILRHAVDEIEAAKASNFNKEQ